MKISRITAIPVNVPYKVPSVMSAGASGYSTRTVVIAETDSGIVGFGEASYAAPAQIIERDFAPAVVGLDPLDHSSVRGHCLPAIFDYGTPNIKARLAAWGGLEIALWDILGKYAKLPLYQLLGGTCRKRAPFGAYAYADAESSTAVASMVHRAKEAIAATGASLFEFKVGVHPVEVEIEIVRAVHGALAGRAQIAVDANMGMSLVEARRFLASVAPNLENIEEPVASLQQMQKLSQEFGVSVSTHCSDLETMLHYPSIEGIVPTLDVAGGIAGVRRLSEVLHALGRRVWVRSHAEAGIGFAAITHLGISMPALERPAQSLIDLLEDDLVLGERWSVREGGVVPPDRPGLGVELDEQALDRYHHLYLQLGEVQVFPPKPERD